MNKNWIAFLIGRTCIDILTQVNNYLEVVGIMHVHKEGISLDSVRKIFPIQLFFQKRQL